MEDQELRQKLEALEKKVEAIFVSSEKTRKYFLATLIVSAIAFLLPLIGLLFALPSFISTYSQIGNIQ
jgi:hypothetical protein